MPERPQPERWRCLVTGCNPRLDEASAKAHTETAQHRTAKWPVRSAAGQAKANARNKSGYYDKYNVGEKSYAARGLGGFGEPSEYDRYREERTGIIFGSLDEMSDNDWGVQS